MAKSAMIGPIQTAILADGNTYQNTIFWSTTTFLNCKKYLDHTDSTHIARITLPHSFSAKFKVLVEGAAK